MVTKAHRSAISELVTRRTGPRRRPSNDRQVLDDSTRLRFRRIPRHQLAPIRSNSGRARLAAGADGAEGIFRPEERGAVARGQDQRSAAPEGAWRLSTCSSRFSAAAGSGRGSGRHPGSPACSWDRPSATSSAGSSGASPFGRSRPRAGAAQNARRGMAAESSAHRGLDRLRARAFPLHRFVRGRLARDGDRVPDALLARRSSERPSETGHSASSGEPRARGRGWRRQRVNRR